jgi:hypothetical protein
MSAFHPKPPTGLALLQTLGISDQMEGMSRRVLWLIVLSLFFGLD